MLTTASPLNLTVRMTAADQKTTYWVIELRPPGIAGIDPGTVKRLMAKEFLHSSDIRFISQHGCGTGMTE